MANIFDRPSAEGHFTPDQQIEDIARKTKVPVNVLIALGEQGDAKDDAERVEIARRAADNLAPRVQAGEDIKNIIREMAGDDEAASAFISRARQIAEEKYPEQTAKVRAARAEAQKGGIGTALGVGVDALQQGYGSAVEGAGKAMGMPGVEAYGADVAARNRAQIEEAAPGLTGLDEIDGIGSAAKFAGETLAQQVPQLGVSIGAGIAGAKGGGALGGAVGGPAGAAIGAVVGGIGAGVAANIPFFYGQNRERQKEAIEQGVITEMDEGAALLTAGIQAPLDAIADRLMIGAIAGPMMKAGGGLFTRGVQGATKGVISEVPTEIGQAILERAQAGLPLDTDDAIREYRDVGIAAGLVGGTVGGAAGALGGDAEPVGPVGDRADQEDPTEPLVDAAPPAPLALPAPNRGGTIFGEGAAGVDPTVREREAWMPRSGEVNPASQPAQIRPGGPMRAALQAAAPRIQNTIAGEGQAPVVEQPMGAAGESSPLIEQSAPMGDQIADPVPQRTLRDASDVAPAPLFADVPPQTAITITVPGLPPIPATLLSSTPLGIQIADQDGEISEITREEIEGGAVQITPMGAGIGAQAIPTAPAAPPAADGDTSIADAQKRLMQIEDLGRTRGWDRSLLDMRDSLQHIVGRQQKDEQEALAEQSKVSVDAPKPETGLGQLGAGVSDPAPLTEAAADPEAESEARAMAFQDARQAASHAREKRVVSKILPGRQAKGTPLAEIEVGEHPKGGFMVRHALNTQLRGHSIGFEGQYDSAEAAEQAARQFITDRAQRILSDRADLSNEQEQADARKVLKWLSPEDNALTEAVTPAVMPMESAGAPDGAARKSDAVMKSLVAARAKKPIPATPDAKVQDFNDYIAAVLRTREWAVTSPRGKDADRYEVHLTRSRFREIEARYEREKAGAAPAADAGAQIEAAAAETAVDPTPAQAEAENYRTGKTVWNGLKLSIENAKGSVRRKVTPDGKTAWEVTMPAHYGRILRTEGADGDHVDFYMGDKPESEWAYVVDQVDAESGDFDEHKLMLGFASRADALAAYDAAFSDGKGPRRRAAVTEMAVQQAKDWLANGDTKKPMADLAGLKAKADAQRNPETQRGVEMYSVFPDQDAVPVERMRALSDTVRREVAEAGLAGKVTPRVVRGLLGASGVPIQGRYRNGEIDVNPAAVDPVGVARHEIIHALRDPQLWDSTHGLFTPEEWKGLVRAARADKALMARIEAAYQDKAATIQTEEAVAEMYREWATARAANGPIARIFAKMQALFRAVASALRGEGFTDAALVMDRIASGEIGGRGPDGPRGGSRSNMDMATVSTKTTEFKRWFADSKVVDADGKPLVIYHGTRRAFDAFEVSPGRARTTGDADAVKGFFFSSSKGVADTYAADETFGDKVKRRLWVDRPRAEEVYLSIQKPYDFDMRGGNYDPRVYGDIIEAAKEAGHDGVVIRNVKDDGYADTNETSDVWIAFRPTQIKSVFNRGTWSPDDPRILEMRGETPRRPVGLDAVIIGGDLGSITTHPDYAAAKAGDVVAAVRLARDMVNDDLVEKVRAAIGDKRPVIVPVASVEQSGRNKIPPVAAVVLAGRLGLADTGDIVQANSPKRTSLSGLDRIFSSPEFDGPVIAGQEYLLLDDTLTQGGTFAALASHIEANGGKVVGAVALTGKQYSAKVKLSPETLSALREKHGDTEQDFIAATGYGFDSLTESEARYLTNFKPAIAVRDRILEVRDKGRDGAGEANPSEIGGPGTSDGGDREMRDALMQTSAKAKGLIGSDHWQEPGEFISNFITDRMVSKNASILALVPGRALFSEMGKNLASAKAYVAAKDAMDQLRNEWHAKAADVAGRWHKVGSRSRVERETLHDLMHRSTVTGIDPTKPDDWGKNDPELAEARQLREQRGDNIPAWAKEKMQQEADHAVAYAAVMDLYTALPEDFREIYVTARDTLSTMADDIDAAIIDNVKQSMASTLKKAERQYQKDIRTIADQGLKGLEAADAKAKADERIKKMRARGGFALKAKARLMRKQFESNRLKGPYFPLARFGEYFVTIRDSAGKVVSFSRFKTARAQRAFIKAMNAEGHDRISSGAMEDKTALKNQVDQAFITEIETILADAGADQALMDAVWQRWLETLPDQSIRTSKIHRKGREGWNQDALRSFASHLMHGAHQLARLKYGTELEEAIDLAREEAQKAADPNRAIALVNEMARRKNWTMNPKNSPWVAAASSAAFVWYLGVSPAAALVNISQTTIFGPAITKARFRKVSVARITAEIARAAKDFAQGQGESWSETWSAANAQNLSKNERDAMAEGYRSGMIDKTQAHDLASVAESGVEFNPWREKWMKRIGWGFHHAERLNREVTFLSNYRIARTEGLSHNAAIGVASDLTWKTHFSYQNSDRPRFMQDDFPKFFLQFRQFTVNTLWRLFRDAHQSLNGATKEERAEARTQLIGITLSMMAHAGIKGTWGYGMVMLLLGLFFPGGDDDAEKWLQDSLLMEGDAPGVAAWNFTMAMALNGAPGQILGVDLTNRIGSPNLWFRGDSRDLEGEDLLQAYVNETLGPTVGIAFSFARGLQNLGEGEAVRGIEQMVPKAMRDIIKAGRYAADGVTTKRGDQLVDDVSAWDLILQANGFTPARVAERYAVNNRLFNAQERIEADKRKIHKMAVDSLTSGQGITPDIRDRIAAFNKKFPRWPVTWETISRARKDRMRRKTRTEFGTELNPRLNAQLRADEPPLINQ